MNKMKIILTIAITMATTITLMRMKGISEEQAKTTTTQDLIAMALPPPPPYKTGSRFLAEVRNPRAADHCRKDNEVCYLFGQNSTCCNNKCMDLSNDDKNCGACKNKCKFTESCCRGQCVNLAFDKRHCGKCNNRCETGQFCVYGMCDYA